MRSLATPAMVQSKGSSSLPNYFVAIQFLGQVSSVIIIFQKNINEFSL